RKEDLQSARAQGVGNPVIYVGSATGRDGIHGASLLASAEFDAESAAKRPTVQVGDPFAEKLLIEACLEAMKTGAIVAIQDMGAAGLSSSSSEMAGRGGLGIDLDLDRIPLREPGLTPYEMLLSESQERMLLVAERGREAEIIAVFAKWDLHAPIVGRITDSGRWRATYRGRLVADVPVAALSDEAPIYDRPAAAPQAVTAHTAQKPRRAPDHREALRALLASPNIGSKRWVFRQYDSIVQSNTIAGPGGDAAILRIKGSRRGLALTVDSNPRACAIDPYRGMVAVVCEAARNLACTGARPAGITNCLNYGNPERPEIMWQFIRGIEGLRDAAIAFDTPVISGNVSFYNETAGRAIPPTPTIAMVGTLDDVSAHLGPHFRTPGDLILMVRTTAPSLAASEYAELCGGAYGAAGAIDLRRERRLLEGLIEAAGKGLLSSAHDVADGGLAVALAECCFNPLTRVGAAIDSMSDNAAELFGEGTATVILSCAPQNLDALRRTFEPLGTRMIGRVIADARLIIQPGIDEDLATLKRLHEDALPRRIESN
ncbi:MAG TPA: phosphoribosylformylglycinamidine synthase subunit PurL, partial [Candidatus Binataceae bacterium]|nr:phosphoribosylformylglycinamidine synthase subunit PurL [Candidatus Binataceae bacterium]